MITVKPYKNELVYSIIARTKARLNYAKNKTFMEEVLCFPHKNPSVLFTDKYTPLQLQRFDPLATYIEENTLFGVFSSLIPLSDRKKAYSAILNQDGNFHSFLHLPRQQPKFAYCPLCAKEHRQLYGETFWDKTCFIPNLSVCPTHNCYLKFLDLKPFNGYYVADQLIPNDYSFIECTNNITLSLNHTILSVSLFKPDDDFILKNFLNLYLTNYKKGCIVQIGQLFEDMQNRYGNEFERESIHNIILGRRWNFKDTCYLLDFLGVKELKSVPPSIIESKDDDTYKLVAEELNVPLDLVTKIANSLRKYSVSTKKGINYEVLDTNYINMTRNVCENLKKEHKRITFHAVQTALNLPDQQLQKHLPKCRKIVEEYMLTNEQWRVEKLIYACEIMHDKNIPFTISNLIKFAAMKKDYLIQALNNLDDINPYKQQLKEILL